MPGIAHDGQSLQIDGRRTWLVTARLDYAITSPGSWARRLAAMRQAGFNTVATACPWLVHEPRKGRFTFEGEADIGQFLTLCQEAGLWVILRAGPFVGEPYDGGGLPPWLKEIEGLVPREANGPFLERAAKYFRKLTSVVSDLLVTKGGPIVLMQAEHAWTCANADQAAGYLSEIERVLRECGIDVPLLNANELWQETSGTINTWSGWNDLLVHLRQLASIQTDAPRFVQVGDPAGWEAWSGQHDKPATSEELLVTIAQVLAAGAQPIVEHVHASTIPGFLGGRLAGRADAFITSSAVHDSMFDDRARQGGGFNGLRRLLMFADQFGHVFADLDPGYHPIVADIAEVMANNSSRTAAGRNASTAKTAIVPLRGSQGRVVFVFASTGSTEHDLTLLLDDGIRLPVRLGDQPVGWYVFDIDLHGQGVLDYTNLCPFALVDRSILVLHGPARAPAYLSINGSPLQSTVPAGGKPTVHEHKGITVVICNRKQIDATYCDADSVFVGVDGLDALGQPIGSGTSAKAYQIRCGAEMISATVVDAANGKVSADIGPWSAAPATSHVQGKSPRFASLDGPATLTACGAGHGYGWYRITLKSKTARKRQFLLAETADRAHLFVNGRAEGIVGVGPDAETGPIQLKFEAGENTIVALVDNLGRFAGGNELIDPKGLFGHIHEMRLLKGARAKVTQAEQVDPFQLRGYISGRAYGQISHSMQAVWSFTHTRTKPIIMTVEGVTASGTWVLNDVALAYFSGQSGSASMRLVLSPKKLESFKRGKNTLRFAPDDHDDDKAKEMAQAAKLYECTETLTEAATWSFARWEPLAASAYKPVDKTTARALKGVPCWWKTWFTVENAADAGIWIEPAGLGKGQIFVNGHNLGRYFTTTPNGHSLGPVRRLSVPASWLREDQDNELLVFDEQGRSPFRCQIIVDS